MRLVNADFYRDGGSLSAEFENDDGTRLFLFLQIAWSSQRYTKLYAYDSFQGRRDPDAIVEKDSVADRQIITKLREWLKSLPADILRRQSDGELRRSDLVADRELHWAIMLCEKTETRDGN